MSRDDMQPSWLVEQARAISQEMKDLPAWKKVPSLQDRRTGLPAPIELLDPREEHGSVWDHLRKD